MKYIVKNCPACRQYQVGIYTCDDFYDCDLQRCQDCTDCVIKQVIEKCMHEAHGDPWQIVRAGDVFLANDILKLFDIEEVSE